MSGRAGGGVVSLEAQRAGAFADVQFAHLAVERRRFQSQRFGGPAHSVDLATRAVERLQDGVVHLRTNLPDGL